MHPCCSCLAALVIVASIVGSGILISRMADFQVGKCMKLGNDTRQETASCHRNVWLVFENDDFPNGVEMCLERASFLNEMPQTCWSDGRYVTFIDPALDCLFYFGNLIILGLIVSCFCYVQNEETEREHAFPPLLSEVNPVSYNK